MPKSKNIYEIINNFNHIFGEQPISIKPEMIMGVHVYIKILYDNNVDIPANKIPNDWNEHSNSGQNYGMVSIWVTRNEKTKEPELILFNENIYINHYTMPDKEKATRFSQARKDFAGSYINLAVGSQKVTFSNKMLDEFISKAKQDIEKTQNCLLNEKKIDKIQQYAKEIIKSIDTLKLLNEIRESQSKKTLRK